MAKAEIRVVLDDRKLRQLAREFERSGDEIVRSMAFEIEGEAKMNAPVDTSALRNSIYTETDRGSFEGGRPLNGGLPDLRLPARGKRSRRLVTSLSQAHLPRPRRHEAHIGPSVEYGLYVELGANGRAGQPFLETAVVKVAQGSEFQRAVRKVLKSYE